MITPTDFYHVMTAMVPLYVAMILAYGSVKWWKIFTPDQCSGINRFVALFAVPLLSFHFISTNDPYTMNFKFIAADTLQKVIVLVVLFVWAKGMYGDFSGSLMVQIVVLQCIIWPSNYEEEGGNKPRFHYHGQGGGAHYPAPNPGMFSPKSGGGANNVKKPNGQAQKGEDGGKDLHMFVWSSSASPVSDVFGNNNHDQFAANESKDVRLAVSPGKVENQRENQEDYMERNEFSFGNRENMTQEAEKVDDGKPKAMPPSSVMTRLILIMVWRKLIRNPNTYSSLIGLTWSLVSFRWNLVMPAIIAKSISILSDAGLGMAMFSLGLFMALQPRIIACGNSVATFAMAVRFLTGPAVMAAASIAVGLKGVLLHVAIVQVLSLSLVCFLLTLPILLHWSALPQGIVPFVFAKEYSVHPDILSTAVIFGMLIALPITLVYYILLGI
ncbi:hypothetical protein NL676_002159 [Syzygium grande]|nr:hypothetical protein NL676_002159 [Syzygium grande]